MIAGIGVDMTEISRLESALARTPGLADRLFAQSERMDAVTAVSGSGPAYVFLLAEALAQAGAAAGLPPPLAEKLARETVAGSGEAAAPVAA